MKSIFASEHILVLSCALILIQTGCGSDDGTPAQSGTGGSSSASTVPSSTSLGGNTANPNTSAGGNPSTGGTGAAGGATGSPSSYLGKLVINEVVASNKTGAVDEGGSYPDWFELYNMSAEDIGLAGFYVSDAPDNLTRAALDASLTVKAGGVLLLWADGDIDQGVLHMPFALSAAGESLYLLDPAQNIIDSVEWTQASADASYARLPDGTGSFSWCSKATPHAINGQACPN